MNKKEKSTKKYTAHKHSRKLVILLAAVLLTGILAGGLLARYRSNNQRQAEMIAAQFHVSSDYLKESNSENSNSIPSYNITDWKDGFEIQLYNYEKENTALVSDENISYEASVTPADKWQIADSSDGTFKDTLDDVLETKSNADGSMKKQTDTLVVKPKDGATINQNDKVTVTVTTTAPFTKTLSATFTVASTALPDNQLEQSSEDTNQWHLIISTNDYSGTVNINWNQLDLCPDTTNEHMDTWTNNGTNNLDVLANTTYDLVFFSTKTGSKFKLEATSGTAITIQ